TAYLRGFGRMRRIAHAMSAARPTSSSHFRTVPSTGGVAATFVAVFTVPCCSRDDALRRRAGPRHGRPLRSAAASPAHSSLIPGQGAPGSDARAAAATGTRPERAPHPYESPAGPTADGAPRAQVDL